MFLAVFSKREKPFRHYGAWFMGGALIVLSFALQAPNQIEANVKPAPGDRLLTSTPPPACTSRPPPVPPTNTAVPSPNTSLVYSPMVVKLPPDPPCTPYSHTW